MHKPDPTLQGRTHTWDFEVNSAALRDKQIRESLEDAYLRGMNQEQDRWLHTIDHFLSLVDDIHGEKRRSRVRRLLNALIRRTDATRNASEKLSGAAQSTPATKETS